LQANALQDLSIFLPLLRAHCGIAGLVAFSWGRSLIVKSEHTVAILAFAGVWCQSADRGSSGFATVLLSAYA
jgi:hypothetical protein